MAGKTKTELCQMALGKIAVSLALSNVDTDQTNQARQCRLFYAGALDRALKALPWSFASRTAPLADIGTPPSRWTFRYTYPADCVKARKVLAPGDHPESLGAPFEIVEDEAGGGLALCSDIEDAELVYTARIANTALFSQDFIDVLTWSLAMDLAPVLAATADVAKFAGSGYQTALLTAKGEGKNETAPPAESEYITARL